MADYLSITLIRKILQGEIAKRAQKMSDAIFGDPDVFDGTLPMTVDVLAVIIATFLSAQGAYAVGGSLRRSAFITAKKALYAAVLKFAPYVDGIANGNAVILALCTLPLLSQEPNYAALISAGGIVQRITAVQGAFVRQIVTNCASFGEKLGYTVIVSEGVPLPAGFALTSNGTVISPAGNRIFVNNFGARKKTFSDLLPKTEYFVYYVLTFGTVVGTASAPVSIVTSA